MNLDDLKARLAEQDAKLDQILRLNASAVREIQLSKTKASLRGLAGGVAFELALAAVDIVWLGNFIAGHLREPQFLLPAVLIDLGMIALLGSCVRQLVSIAGLDYGRPVVAVQKELGRLRVLRLRTTKWTMVLSFALWFPVLVVLFEGLVGVDLWWILGMIADRSDRGGLVAWLVGNVLFGLAAALAILWVAKRQADRLDRSPAMRRLLDGLAGRSLTKALSSLDSIVRFEAEPAG